MFFDIIVLAVVGILTIAGLYSGMVKQVFGACRCYRQATYWPCGTISSVPSICRPFIPVLPGQSVSLSSFLPASSSRTSSDGWLENSFPFPDWDSSTNLAAPSWGLRKDASSSASW